MIVKNKLSQLALLEKIEKPEIKSSLQSLWNEYDCKKSKLQWNFDRIQWYEKFETLFSHNKINAIFENDKTVSVRFSCSDGMMDMKLINDKIYIEFNFSMLLTTDVTKIQ